MSNKAKEIARDMRRTINTFPAYKRDAILTWASNLENISPLGSKLLPEMAGCFRCGKMPTKDDINSEGNVYHSCGDPGLDRPVLFRTRDVWLRHCAENTPCGKCGTVPRIEKKSPVAGLLYCGNTDCEAGWDLQDLSEWMERNP